MTNLRMPPKGDKGALVAKAAYGWGDEGRDNAQKGNDG